MSDGHLLSLDAILEHCARAEPEPWYPSDYARQAGVAREQLDPLLDELRLGGLVRLTDWVQGKGQGYALTPAGRQVFESPRQVARLRAGRLPATAPEAVPETREQFATWERGEAFRAAILSPATPWVTRALIAINVAWFLAGVALAQQQHLALNDFMFGLPGDIFIQTGGVTGPALFEHGEWWRLLTCCFVHLGVLHLGVNMYSLYAVGPLLENLWGSWRFLALYLIAGFGGSCAMIVENPHGGGAGASGALFGILGSMATWLFINRRALPPPLVAAWRQSLVRVFIINLFITFGVAQISKGAHLGGAVVGMVAAVPMDYLRFGRGPRWWAALVSLVLIPLACAAGLTWAGERYRAVARVGRPGVAEASGVAFTVTSGAFWQFFDGEGNDLLQRLPKARDPRAVEKASEQLGHLLLQQTVTLQLLDKAGPLDDPAAEERRHDRVHSVEVMQEYCQLAVKCLRAGEGWSAKQQEDLADSRRRVDALRRDPD